MKRAALLACLLASCVASSSGPVATGPAYSGVYVSASASAPAMPEDYQPPHSGYDFNHPGYPAGYPAGYSAGYPDGYPMGVEAYPQQECKTAYGSTACGFGCVAAYGQVRCAAMPGGACTAAYGQVTCFEAPQTVSGGYAGACASAYGQLTCTN